MRNIAWSLSLFVASTLSSLAFGSVSDLAWECSRRSMLSTSALNYAGAQLATGISQQSGKTIPQEMVVPVLKQIYPVLLDRHEGRFKLAFDQYFSELLPSLQAPVERFVREQSDCRFFGYIALGQTKFSVEIQKKIAGITDASRAQQIIIPMIVFETGSTELEAQMFSEFYLKSVQPFDRHVSPQIKILSKDFVAELGRPEVYSSVADLLRFADSSAGAARKQSTWKSSTGGSSLTCDEVNGKLVNCR